jgi:ribonuclease D
MQQDSEIQFEFVETTSALDALLKSLRGVDALAVDLEADSMFHFQEKVCLIQIAFNSRLFIVDPIRVMDLSPLKPIFENSRVKKVFHGSDYDIRSLFRDFNIVVHNLFDTELASRFLGFQQSGLDAMLQAFFQVKLEKKYQKKDWSVRPLPEAMVGYAAKDVRHLLPLAQRLEVLLARKNRLAWVREECDLLSNVRPNETNAEPLFLSFKGAGRLPPQDLAVLEALLAWRKRTARKKDLPLFKIIGNNALLALVREKPRTGEALEASRALSARQTDMYGRQVLNAVAKGLKTPVDRLPVYPRTRARRLPDSKIRIAKKLKHWKEKKAADLAIDPALVLNKTQTMDIAGRSPATVQDLNSIASLKTWQVQTFGEEIIRCIKSNEPDEPDKSN